MHQSLQLVVVQVVLDLVVGVEHRHARDRVRSREYAPVDSEVEDPLEQLQVVVAGRRRESQCEQFGVEGLDLLPRDLIQPAIPELALDPQPVELVVASEGALAGLREGLVLLGEERVERRHLPLRLGLPARIGPREISALSFLARLRASARSTSVVLAIFWWQVLPVASLYRRKNVPRPGLAAETRTYRPGNSVSQSSTRVFPSGQRSSFVMMWCVNLRTGIAPPRAKLAWLETGTCPSEGKRRSRIALIDADVERVVAAVHPNTDQTNLPAVGQVLERSTGVLVLLCGKSAPDTHADLRGPICPAVFERGNYARGVLAHHAKDAARYHAVVGRDKAKVIGVVTHDRHFGA